MTYEHIRVTPLATVVGAEISGVDLATASGEPGLAEIRRALGVGAGDKLLFEKDGSEVRVRPVRTKSPFEKYRGIGSPGIARGRKGVVRWVRELRGR